MTDHRSPIAFAGPKQIGLQSDPDEQATERAKALLSARAPWAAISIRRFGNM
jgi:hypothetical protein